MNKIEQTKPTICCAVYTRKSHEEGLEQDFNSLDAQRLAAESFIASQRHEGWALLSQRYDDGGYSGGTLERPALERLLGDMRAGLIDCVVVYKIDRMSRSLLDFAKLLDMFDVHKVSFVSITQSFNTATSMGRLVLNVLLSFAQYERELTGERIRDKFALSRKKGMWMGGNPPLGYDAADRKLTVNEAEAELVQFIFERFTELKSTTQLARVLNAQGHTTKSWTSRRGKTHQGQAFSKNALRNILMNPLYKGCVVHKGEVYPGEHTAIIDGALWDEAQAVFTSVPYTKGRHDKPSALLKGLLRCQPCDGAMVPTYTISGAKCYHYYVCAAKRKGLETDCAPIAAAEVERFVVQQVRKILRRPEAIAGVCHVVSRDHGLPESKAIEHLQRLEEVWNELFPAERRRIVQMLVETVLMTKDGIDVRIRAEGLKSLVDEVRDEIKPDVEDETQEKQAVPYASGEAA